VRGSGNLYTSSDQCNQWHGNFRLILAFKARCEVIPELSTERRGVLEEDFSNDLDNDGMEIRLLEPILALQTTKSDSGRAKS
jgi:hypothetical protein